MSLADNLSGWRKFALLIVLVVLAGAAYFVSSRPSVDESPEAEPEVISKRVRLEETAGPAPEAAPLESPVPAQPEPAQAIKAPDTARPEKPAAMEKKMAAKAAPSDKVAESAAKTAERPDTKKKPVKTASSTTLAGKAAGPGRAAVKLWAINVASFSNLREAQTLASSLRSAGYGAYITGFTKDGIEWRRVRVGFFSSREEAAKTGKAIGSKYDVEAPWVVKTTRKEAAEYGG